MRTVASLPSRSTVSCTVISTVIDSPGWMLPTAISKISPRCCSMSAAVWPLARASSYSTLACPRSLMSATTVRSPMRSVRLVTAPPFGRGNV